VAEPTAGAVAAVTMAIRAEQLEGRAAAAHLVVVCCVLWVLVWARKRLYLTIPIL
jgi:hypothetical protein